VTQQSLGDIEIGGKVARFGKDDTSR
jgi:hypothetical protein